MENAASYDELKAENAVLRAELAETKEKLDWLLEQLSTNRRKMYGSSSEKSVYDGIQKGMFEESGTVLTTFGAPEPVKAAT